MDVSDKKWQTRFSDGEHGSNRVIPAGNKAAWDTAITRSKKKFGLPPNAPIRTCYEAGRNGHWIHRWLERQGIENIQIDPGSVDRAPGRKAKTDRLDALKLMGILWQHYNGTPESRGTVRVVHVPDEADEDAKRPHRELARLKKERMGHRSRISSLLATVGVHLKGYSNLAENLDKVRQWDGKLLPMELKAEVRRELARLAVVMEQIDELDDRRKQAIDEGKEENVRSMMLLRGMGINGAWILEKEFFGPRNFRNRRQVGSCAGLDGTPDSTGDGKKDKERGISKAGNPRVRSVMNQLAWLWLRYQRQSELSQWYFRRFAKAGPRARKVGIVALQRKLLIAVWKYRTFGEVPQGAEFS
jgi:transposase